MTASEIVLVTPPEIQSLADFLRESLVPVLDRMPVSAVILRLPMAEVSHVQEIARGLLPVLHSRDIACLLAGAPELAAECGFDGVHLSTPEHVTRARKILGKEGQIGAFCGLSRHAALEAVEDGADYVAFGGCRLVNGENPALAELFGWWRDMIEAPSMAMGQVDMDALTYLSRIGADFVALGSGFWNNAHF